MPGCDRGRSVGWVSLVERESKHPSRAELQPACRAPPPHEVPDRGGNQHHDYDQPPPVLDASAGYWSRWSRWSRGVSRLGHRQRRCNYKANQERYQGSKHMPSSQCSGFEKIIGGEQSQLSASARSTGAAHRPLVWGADNCIKAPPYPGVETHRRASWITKRAA